MLKSFRYVLFPFSIIYGIIIWIRNKLFDWKVLKSVRFNFPIICIGNLAVGGTGKTPLTELIVHQLQSTYNIATLSRGYKRKTKGFAIANETTTALEIGDEPMQFHQKFPNIVVAVGEERLVAIPQILYQRPETAVIVLDDAFQHRSVLAGLNIILTDYHNLYTRDFMMPAGDLRDIASSSKRADIIIVTKCPSNLTQIERLKIEKELNLLPHQKCYFTCIQYNNPYHLFDKTVKILNEQDVALLLCGIANPKPIMQYLTDQLQSYEMISYADHHIFSSADLQDIKLQYQANVSANKIMITTEKDAVRLIKFKNELSSFPIFVLPIQHQFLFESQSQFIESLTTFIESYPTQNNKSNIQSQTTVADLKSNN